MPGFDVDPEEITHFCRLSFENQLVGQTRDKVVPELERLGGADGLLSKLQTDVSAGIGGDDDEIARRKAHFGSNYVEPEPPESIFAMAWTALQDPCLIFLCFAAMVSFLVGIMFDQGLEWLEGVAILCAVFVVVTVSAVNDYQKEQQFRELSVVNDNILVTVVRDGVKAKISTHDIVVGDVVLLSTGDQVCADGVIFKDNDLGLTESMLTGESVVKRKGAFKLEESDNPEAPVKIQPTLFAGTLVQEGEGAMIVVAVGKHTYQGNMEEKMKEDEDERSVLQQKLDKMTVLITKAGAVAGVATVLVLFARVGVAFLQAACCREEFDFAVHFLEMLRFLVVGVTVFVVAVPEGLPLAVTIALAFSVKKMMKDQNLVRHLSACETMGSATTICSDKTGTLTTGKMSVVRATFALDAASAPLLSDVNSSASEIPSALQDILAQALVINTSAKSDISWERSTGQATRHQGNDTECAMLALANRLLTAQGAGGDCPYKSVRDEHPGDEPGRRCISFSSDRKRMSTLVPIKGGGGGGRGGCTPRARPRSCWSSAPASRSREGRRRRWMRGRGRGSMRRSGRWLMKASARSRLRTVRSRRGRRSPRTLRRTSFSSLSSALRTRCVRRCLGRSAHARRQGLWCGWSRATTRARPRRLPRSAGSSGTRSRRARL